MITSRILLKEMNVESFLVHRMIFKLTLCVFHYQYVV